MHSANPGYKPGEHWVVCDRCGFDYYASQVKEEWTGLIVCNDCFEVRHPQDFVRGKQDKIVADYPRRPVPADLEVSVTFNNGQDNPHGLIPSSTFVEQRTNLFINGEFIGSNRPWLNGNNWTWANGRMIKTSGTSGNLVYGVSSQPPVVSPFDPTETYTLTVKVTEMNGGTFTPNTSTAGSLTAISAAGTYTYTLSGILSTEQFFLLGDSDSDGTVEEITLVKN